MSQGKNLKEDLDALYRVYNNPGYIRYDPIKYVYRFKDRIERELAGLIASSLSFGRVSQIFKAMDSLLCIMDGKPLKYVARLRKKPERELLSFKYRFVKGIDAFHLLFSAKEIIEEHGSLGEFIEQRYKQRHLLEVMEEFMERFQRSNYLIPSSLKKSPCKRLFMFFRWMVREDNIDLGLWNFISRNELVIPLDTHIFQVSRALGLTSKRSASLGAATEITDNLREYSEDDPVKYDWGLSHIGIIRNNFNHEEAVSIPEIFSVSVQGI
ncbi:MAG: TIGR02757 family protein [Deltaproteobacteria bacterium]|nr:TIGR02757 family protein [Deltaproteobacteria bacterium]